MDNADLGYAAISLAILCGAGLFGWKAYRQREVAAWPAGAEMRILDGLFLAAGICSLLGGVFAVLGTFEFSPETRDWSRTLLLAVLAAAIPFSFGLRLYLRTASIRK